jgi:hemoglobin
MVSRSKWAALAAWSLLAFTACHHKNASTEPSGAGSGSATAPERSLFERLGGKDAIVAVVDDFVANVGADDRINAFFANADIPHLKQMLVDQICQATGGPCQYGGKTMAEAHKGMGIKPEHFDALVEDLTKSLDKFNVGATEKSELLGALGKMKPDIVGQ